MMRSLFVLVVALGTMAIACGPPSSLPLFPGAQWDLRSPVYVAVSDTMPRRDLVLQGTRDAVSQAGGRLTTDAAAAQRLTILDTDGDRCQEPGVSAYTPLPANRTIYVCHSALVLSSATLDYVFDVMLHELGHELANRGDHLPCESRAVMALNIACHRNQPRFTALDVQYVCALGTTHGGPCE